MKWDCDKRKRKAAAKLEAQKQWHKSFALWPHKVGQGDCRWLEYVECKLEWSYRFNQYVWEYRAIK